MFCHRIIPVMLCFIFQGYFLFAAIAKFCTITLDHLKFLPDTVGIFSFIKDIL
ncbi:MAG: hypothetical protein WBB82_14110 [Limnothrix sp.]